MFVFLNNDNLVHMQHETFHLQFLNLKQMQFHTVCTIKHSFMYQRFLPLTFPYVFKFIFAILSGAASGA